MVHCGRLVFLGFSGLSVGDRSIGNPSFTGITGARFCRQEGGPLLFNINGNNGIQFARSGSMGDVGERIAPPCRARDPDRAMSSYCSPSTGWLCCRNFGAGLYRIGTGARRNGSSKTVLLQHRRCRDPPTSTTCLWATDTDTSSMSEDHDGISTRTTCRC